MPTPSTRGRRIPRASAPQAGEEPVGERIDAKNITSPYDRDNCPEWRQLGLRKRLNAVAAVMIDLMEPFRQRDIYHWRMNGSYSMKSVLPVLVPEMTYDDMEMDGWQLSESGSIPGVIERLQDGRPAGGGALWPAGVNEHGAQAARPRR